MVPILEHPHLGFRGKHLGNVFFFGGTGTIFGNSSRSKNSNVVNPIIQHPQFITINGWDYDFFFTITIPYHPQMVGLWPRISHINLNNKKKNCPNAFISLEVSGQCSNVTDEPMSPKCSACGGSMKPRLAGVFFSVNVSTVCV
jgi:hypothetical protein